MVFSFQCGSVLAMAITAKTLHIIKKPGDCEGHEEYPNTFQCAETGLCLPFTSFNNGVKDCCGPKQTATCTDSSDESK